jgi:hypothetical protein
LHSILPVFGRSLRIQTFVVGIEAGFGGGLEKVLLAIRLHQAPVIS